MKKNALQIIVMVIFFPVTAAAYIFKWVFEDYLEAITKTFSGRSEKNLK